MAHLSRDRRSDRGGDLAADAVRTPEARHPTPGKRTLTEQLEGGIAAPVAAPVASAGRPLTDELRADMERAFGADLSSVRIHEGPHAAAIGARAFAQGEAIHFAPGQYDPASARGRELLGHELAHVIQQREGRVRGAQGKGAAINHDPALEAEADRAGALAARGDRVASQGVRSAAAPADAPIQGNFGIELEIQNGWRVWWADHPPELDAVPDKQEKKSFSLFGSSKPKPARPQPRRPVAKGTQIIPGPGFELQAEDSGTESAIELVGNAPGFHTEGEFRTAITGMATLAKKLAAAGEHEHTKLDPAAFGGSRAYELVSGHSFDATMQVTLGVPLASLPRLFELLPDLSDEYGGYKEAATAATSPERLRQLGELLGEAPSPEVIGLYMLVRQYLVAAGSESYDRSFPKGIFKAMARTDFAKMFSMLGPQGALIEAKMDRWIALLTANLPIYSDALREDHTKGASPEALGRGGQRVFKSHFNYDETRQKPPFRIAVTRDEWLRQMPKRDRLARGGAELKDVLVPRKYKAPRNAASSLNDMKVSAQWKNPDAKLVGKLHADMDALYLGMGEYGQKTDLVQYQGDRAPTETVILELRNPKPPGPPSQWEGVVEQYWKAMVRAITEPVRIDGESGQATRDARPGFAMPQNPKQTKMRTKRGEAVTADLDQLMISAESAKLASSSPSAQPRTTDDHDHRDPDEDHAPQVDVEGQVIALFELKGQLENMFRAQAPLDDIEGLLGELAHGIHQLPGELEPRVELARFHTELDQAIRELRAQIQREDPTPAKREEHAVAFQQEQGGGIPVSPEALAGNQLASCLIYLAEVYRWQLDTVDQRTEFIGRVQVRVFPDEDLGYPGGQVDTPDARLAFYIERRQVIRKIYQDYRRELNPGGGLVIHVQQ